MIYYSLLKISNKKSPLGKVGKTKSLRKDYKNFIHFLQKIKFLCMIPMTMISGANMTRTKKLELTSTKTKNNPVNNFSFLREGEFLESSPHPKIEFISQTKYRNMSIAELEKALEVALQKYWNQHNIYHKFFEPYSRNS